MPPSCRSGDSRPYQWCDPAAIRLWCHAAVWHSAAAGAVPCGVLSLVNVLVPCGRCSLWVLCVVLCVPYDQHRMCRVYLVSRVADRVSPLSRVDCVSCDLRDAQYVLCVV